MFLLSIPRRLVSTIRLLLNEFTLEEWKAEQTSYQYYSYNILCIALLLAFMFREMTDNSSLNYFTCITFALATGNFPTVTRVLLAKIPSQDGRMTYQYDNYNFHYITEGGICYLCMSDVLNKHRIPYAFLQDMKDRFLAQYGSEAPLQAIAFSYNEEFSRTIQQRMDYYNSDEADRSIDSLGAVKSQIEDVKSTMVENIEKILERGEKIELLVDKTENLQTSSFLFESSSRNLRRAMYWRQIRCYIGIGAAVVFLLFLATSSLCGGLTFSRCRRH